MTTDEEKQVAFLPFHALNEFMRDDYRLTVIRTALKGLPNLPENFREPVEQLTRRVVRVPGFRNSQKAPAALKVKPIADAFEKNPELVAAILAAWSEVQSELRGKVYDLLKDRGWEILPAEADRTVLPGFLTVWPRGEDFEVLNDAFAEKYPGTESSSDDVSLMVVWLSGRLPYQIEGSDEEEDDEKSESEAENED
jgi:hypothetical protein